VILPNVETISPKTYGVFDEFARAGGALAATRQLPSAAPGFPAGESQDAEIREISRRLFQSGSSSSLFISDEAKLSEVLRRLMDSDVAFTPAAPEVGFIHRRLPDADIYFVANTSSQRELVDASFRVSDREAQRWDAMTGKISPARVQPGQPSRTTIPLALEPYGSRVLVFSRSRSIRKLREAPLHSTTIDISHDWRVTFSDRRTETMRDLHSWTEDLDTRYFSGVANYEKTITVSPGMLHNSSIVLDLGDGKPLTPQPLKAGMQAWLDGPIREAAVVYVNGRRAGSIWCPPYSLEIRPLLHDGENSLRIQVANLALNHMAAHPLPDYRLLNLRYGVRFEAQDMDKVAPVISGLVHEITLKMGITK